MPASPSRHSSKAGHMAKVQDPAQQHPHSTLCPRSSTPGNPVTEAQPSTKMQPQPGDTREHKVSIRGDWGIWPRLRKALMALRCHSRMDHCAEEKQPAPKSLLLACVPGSLPALGSGQGTSRTGCPSPRPGYCNPQCAGSPAQTEPAKMFPHWQS